MRKWIQSGNNTYVQLDDEVITSITKHDFEVFITYKNDQFTRLEFSNKEKTNEVFDDIIKELI